MTLSEAELKQVREALERAQNAAEWEGYDGLYEELADALALLDAKPTDARDAVREAWADTLDQLKRKDVSFAAWKIIDRFTQALATPQAPETCSDECGSRNCAVCGKDYKQAPAKEKPCQS